MLRFIIALIAVALVGLTNAFGYDHSSAWQLKEKRTEKLLNNIGTLYHFNAYQYKHFPVALTLIEINQDKARASLVIQDKSNIQPLQEIAMQSGAIIATNGGFYRENFLVNGLLISHDKKYSRLVKNSLLSAVVTISQKGIINLYKIGDSGYNDAFWAFQAGPILVDNNHPQKKLDDSAIARRVIYITTNQGLYLALLDGATLNESANILKSVANKLKLQIHLAVNFDGGKAAAFRIQTDNKILSHSELVPVKSIIVIK